MSPFTKPGKWFRTAAVVAIAEGRTDLAGTARYPEEEDLAAGVRVTLVGRDASAVIVHPDNPVRDLGTSQLRGLFTGNIRRWSEVGGPDRPVIPFIVGPESATQQVFRAAILGGTTTRRPAASSRPAGHRPSGRRRAGRDRLLPAPALRHPRPRGEARASRAQPLRPQRREPPPVRLEPGTYLVRPESSGERVELFVNIEPGKLTELHVARLLEERR